MCVDLHLVQQAPVFLGDVTEKLTMLLFSVEIMSLLIYSALGLCCVGIIILLTIFIREIMQNNIW